MEFRFFVEIKINEVKTHRNEPEGSCGVEIFS